MISPLTSSHKHACCVCHRYFADADLQWIGGRTFCAVHHERAISATEAKWSRAGLLEAGLVVLFVLGVSLAFAGGSLPSGGPAALLLALVPAAIWLVYVYRQDRVEPEPLGLVLGVFVLGGLLEHALGDPLVHTLLQLDTWQHRSDLSAWVGAVTIEGTVAVLCAYLAVRYSVYLTSEFDEAIDGVIYATAASLGVATSQNFDLVAHHDHLLPVAGATAMASTTLVAVAAGSLLGYGLGRRRFDAKEGGRWLAGAFLIAAVVHGVFHELIVAAGTSAGEHEPLLGFGVAVGLTVFVLVGVHAITVGYARKMLADGRGDDVDEDDAFEDEEMELAS